MYISRLQVKLFNMQIRKIKNLLFTLIVRLIELSVFTR